jgi:hypothetical protein
MTAMTDITTATTAHDEVPAVRLEPCSGYRPDHDASWPVCEVCGWLEHDHAGTDGTDDAVVTTLPRRVAAVPQRLAS